MSEEKPQEKPQEKPEQKAEENAQGKAIVSFEEFAKLDLRVARIIEVSDHPNADKLLVLKVDMGDHVRQLVAGIRGSYQAAEMVGRQIVVVANLAPRVVRGVESQGMLLAAGDESDGARRPVILAPAGPVPPGSSVS